MAAVLVARKAVAHGPMKSQRSHMQSKNENDLAFETESFRGRLVGSDDLSLYVDLYTSPIVMLHLGGAMTRSQAVAWFEKVLRWNAEENVRARYWSISENSTGRLVGCVSLVFHRRPALHGEVGIMLLPPAWRDGYSRQIMSGFIQRIFAPEWGMGLSELTAVCSANNRSACMLVEKLGFTAAPDAGTGLRTWRMRQCERQANPPGNSTAI